MKNAEITFCKIDIIPNHFYTASKNIETATTEYEINFGKYYCIQIKPIKNRGVVIRLVDSKILALQFFFCRFPLEFFQMLSRTQCPEKKVNKNF